MQWGNSGNQEGVGRLGTVCDLGGAGPDQRTGGGCLVTSGPWQSWHAAGGAGRGGGAGGL